MVRATTGGPPSCTGNGCTRCCAATSAEGRDGTREKGRGKREEGRRGVGGWGSGVGGWGSGVRGQGSRVPVPLTTLRLSPTQKARAPSHPLPKAHSHSPSA
ncbi:MAG: hypothetical protein DWQ36_12000 [Acidobacteria bacterium]|nr:MAG: hypothetical protein DWQ30_25775 [Acidobacteriota bacterium]REK07268.1 MAG: hypothetical protein DWQ36_12000 [Acidobacteriota bacterium]